MSHATVVCSRCTRSGLPRSRRCAGALQGTSTARLGNGCAGRASFVSRVKLRR